jgi:hypothetical protein
MESPCCLCICVIPLQLLGNKCKRKNKRIVGRVVFYAVYVISKESRRLFLPRVSCLLLGTHSCSRGCLSDAKKLANLCWLERIKVLVCLASCPTRRTEPLIHGHRFQIIRAQVT